MLLFLLFCCSMIAARFPADGESDQKIGRQFQCSEKVIDGSSSKSALCFNHWPTRGSLSPQVVDLTIHAARVPKINASMFQDTGLNVSQLTALRLIKCNIQFIEADSLFALTSLKILELPENQLKFLTAGQFSHNQRLTRLVLRANQFNAFQRSTFSVLRSLHTLDLSENQLTNVPANLPQALEQLYLADNQINRIESSNQIANLRHLNLCRNEIADVSLIGDYYPKLESLCIGDKALLQNSKGFKNLNNLKELTLVGPNTQQADLSDTLLQSLSLTCTRLKKLSIKHYQFTALTFLTNLTRLTSLELNQVYVSKAPTGAVFQKCPELETIDLSDSQQLSHSILYDEDIQKSLLNVRHLKVQNCGLIDLKWFPVPEPGPPASAVPLPSLTNVDISRNPLNCRDNVTHGVLCHLRKRVLSKSPTPRVVSAVVAPPRYQAPVVHLENTDLTKCQVGIKQQPISYSDCPLTVGQQGGTTVKPEKRLGANVTQKPAVRQENKTSQMYVWYIVLGVVLIVLMFVAITLAIVRLQKKKKDQADLETVNEQQGAEPEGQSFNKLKASSQANLI